MKIVVFTGEDGQFYVKWVARNGKTMLVSEGYTTRDHAHRSVSDFMIELAEDVGPYVIGSVVPIVDED